MKNKVDTNQANDKGKNSSLLSSRIMNMKVILMVISALYFFDAHVLLFINKCSDAYYHDVRPLFLSNNFYNIYVYVTHWCTTKNVYCTGASFFDEQR